MRFALLLAALTACHLRAGLDATSTANGPLHQAMSQSTVSRTNGVITLPPENGRNYSLEAGFGNKTFTVNSVLAVHDVTSTSFTPGSGMLAGTVGVNVRWRVFDWHHLSPSLAAGPARMMIMNRETGDRQWGNGLRFSGGAQYQLGPVAVFADAYREVAAFGAGMGTTTLDGVTFGVALQP